MNLRIKIDFLGEIKKLLGISSFLLQYINVGAQRLFSKRFFYFHSCPLTRGCLFSKFPFKIYLISTKTKPTHLCPFFGKDFQHNSNIIKIKVHNEFKFGCCCFCPYTKLFQLTIERDKEVNDFLKNITESEIKGIEHPERYWDSLARQNVLFLLPNFAKKIIALNKVIKPNQDYTLLKLN